MPKGLLLAAGPIIFTDVLFEAPHRKSLLFFREPRCRPGEIRENPVCEESNKDCGDAFDDKKPARVQLGPLF
jgi:hypothetical protein